jgi:hypothetical protein
VTKIKREREDKPTRFLKNFIRTYLKKNRDIPPSIIVMLLDRLALLDGLYKVELTPRRTTTGPGKTESEQIPEVEIDIDKMLERGAANAADNSEANG